MLFLIQKQQAYIALARETPGKCGYIDVFVKNSRGRYQLYWSFMPEPNYPPIFLVSIVRQNLLLIVNRMTELRLYDLDRQQELASAKTITNRLLGAGIYPSESKGFLITSSPNRTAIEVFEFDLTPPLTVNLKQSIPGIGDLHRVTVLDEYHLVGYLPAGSGNETNPADGFLTVDTTNLTYQKHYLKPAPTGNFSQPAVAFDPLRKIGIRPSYEPIEIIKSGGIKTYLANALLFDLETGKTIRNLTTREFSPGDLFEDDNPDYALSCLELPPNSEEYCEVKEEFLERFEAFRFCNLEDAFWVTFQHGMLRKVSLEGQYRSPLVKHPGTMNPTGSSSLCTSGFDTPLDLSPDDRFLSFGTPAVTIRTSDLDRMDADQLLKVENEQILEVDNRNRELVDTPFSWNVIETGQLAEPSAADTILKILLRKTETIDSFRDGPFFRFLFKTPQGIISEKRVFRDMEWNGDRLTKSRQILENLIRFGKSIWHDESTPALFSLTRAVVLQNEGNLDLLVRYVGTFTECKADEDPLNTLIQEVIAKYGWQQETIDLLLTRASFQGEKGLEQLEFYLQQPDFKVYLSHSAHKDYFRQHTLFRSLAEDHFSLFFPNEDELFAAIEIEDVEKLETLLAIPLDLNLIHPEFNLNALDLALELGNRKMIALLTDKGALSDSCATTNKPVPQPETNRLDISLDKAINTLLRDLNQQQATLQKQIYDIEFDHMVTFSLSPEQSALLANKNAELKTIQSQIKAANLGLLSWAEISKATESLNETDLSPSPEPQKISGAEDFIKDQSHAYEDPAATMIEIDDLSEHSQLDAFDRMEKLLVKPENVVFGGMLRFSFKIDNRVILEDEWFKLIQLTPKSYRKLSEFIYSLSAMPNPPVWYDDEIPAGFHAIRKLCLFSLECLETILFYLKPFGVNHAEPDCITDLVFDIYEQHGWNASTLALVASRLCLAENSSGLNEFRIQWKKGGLQNYLEDGEIKTMFLRLLDRYRGKDSIEWFNRFIR